MSDRMPEDMSEYMPEDMPHRMPDWMPEDMSDRVPEDMPDRMPEDLPDRMPEDMPEDMPDHMPEDMPDRMPNRMSEDMSDRMPEDLPVRKCINVMVGITRSKVIFEFAKVKFYFAKVSRKLGIIIIICKGLPPTAARGPAGEGHQGMRVAVAKFPKWGFARAKHQGPWFSLFLQCIPCWWPGSVNRDIFAKVPRKLCERAGESQSACWRGWASKLCKKSLSWEGIPWC